MTPLLFAMVADPIDPPRRRDRLEAVLESEAEVARTMRMRVGIGAMLTGSVLLPLGLSTIRREVDGESATPGFGTSITLAGALIAGVGLVTTLVRSDFESMHDDMVRARRAHESPWKTVERVEQRWRQLAARERGFRNAGWIMTGAGVLLLGLSAWSQMASPSTAFTSSFTGMLGSIYVIGGLVIASTPGYYERGFQIYQRSLGLALVPTAGGAAGAFTMEL